MLGADAAADTLYTIIMCTLEHLHSALNITPLPPSQTDWTCNETDRQMTALGDMPAIVYTDTTVTRSQPAPKASEEAPCMLVRLTD
jgi:hypothetical protein